MAYLSFRSDKSLKTKAHFLLRKNAKLLKLRVKRLSIKMKPYDPWLWAIRLIITIWQTGSIISHFWFIALPHVRHAMEMISIIFWILSQLGPGGILPLL